MKGESIGSFSLHKSPALARLSPAFAGEDAEGRGVTDKNNFTLHCFCALA